MAFHGQGLQPLNGQRASHRRANTPPSASPSAPPHHHVLPAPPSIPLFYPFSLGSRPLTYLGSPIDARPGDSTPLHDNARRIHSTLCISKNCCLYKYCTPPPPSPAHPMPPCHDRPPTLLFPAPTRPSRPPATICTCAPLSTFPSCPLHPPTLTELQMFDARRR